MGQPPMEATGPPGRGDDPYSQNRWTRTLPMSHKRVASETYWKLRGSAASVRDYMAVHYQGARDTQEWHDLWAASVSVDVTLEEAYKKGGYPEVCRTLEEDDRLEVWLCRLGAQVAFLRTGDRSMLRELQASTAPGQTDILPGWAIEAARNQGKSEFQQQGRVRAGYSSQNQREEGGQGGAFRRPRRPPGKAGGGNGGGGGGGAAAKPAAKAKS